PELLATPCGDPPGGGCVLADRSRLDERHAGERPAHVARQARERRHDHDRLDRHGLRAEACHVIASVAVGEALLILKLLFLLLLYLFIWRIVRTASRDLRLPQESVILSPAKARAAGLLNSGKPPAHTGRLVFPDGDE